MLDTILRRLEPGEQAQAPDETEVKIDAKGGYWARLTQGSFRYAVVSGRTATMADLMLELNGPDLPAHVSLPCRLVVTCRRDSENTFARALHRTDGATPAATLKKIVWDRLTDIMREGHSSWMQACVEGLTSRTALKDCSDRIGADLRLEFVLPTLANQGLIQPDEFEVAVRTSDSPVSHRLMVRFIATVPPGLELFARMLPEPFEERRAVSIVKEALQQAFIRQIATDEFVEPYNEVAPNGAISAETVHTRVRSDLDRVLAPYHRSIASLQLRPSTLLPENRKELRVQLHFPWHEGNNFGRKLDLDIECQVRLTSYRRFMEADHPNLSTWLEENIKHVLGTSLRSITRAAFLLDTNKQQEEIKKELSRLTGYIGWKVNIFVSRPSHRVIDLCRKGQTIFVEAQKYELQPTISGGKVLGNVGVVLHLDDVSADMIIERYLEQPDVFLVDIKSEVRGSLQTKLRRVGPDAFYLKFDELPEDGSTTLRQTIEDAIRQDIAKALPYIRKLKVELQPDTAALRECVSRFKGRGIRTRIEEAPFEDGDVPNLKVPVDIAVEIDGPDPRYWAELMAHIEEENDLAQDELTFRDLTSDVMDAVRRAIQHLPWEVVAYLPEKKALRDARAAKLEAMVRNSAAQVVGEKLGLAIKVRKVVRGRTSHERNLLDEEEAREEVWAAAIKARTEADKLRLQHAQNMLRTQQDGQLEALADKNRDEIPDNVLKLGTSTDLMLPTRLPKSDATTSAPPADKP